MKAKHSRLCVSAPGKVMICGEYAVLCGAPALVAACSRRVYVRSRDAGSLAGYDPSGSIPRGSGEIAPLPPEVEVGLRLKMQSLSARSDRSVVHFDAPEIDVSALMHTISRKIEGTKLGLGSSSAAAVAAVAWADAMQGHTLDPDSIFSVALQAHRTVAPAGSGVDVAASTWGGWLELQGSARSKASIDIKHHRPFSDLHFRVLWSAQAMRTSSMLEVFGSVQTRGQDRIVQKITDASSKLISAWDQQSSEGVIDATRLHREAQNELGALMKKKGGAEMETPVMAAMANAAEHVGGAAKPSGAGGGDIVWAVFAQRSAAEAFDLISTRQGWVNLQMDLGVEGVRVEL